MTEKDPSIYKALKDKFEHFESEPSALLWQKIEKNLAQTKKKNNIRKGITGSFILLCTAALGSAYWWYTIENSMRKNESAPSADITLVQPSKNDPRKSSVSIQKNNTTTEKQTDSSNQPVNINNSEHKETTLDKNTATGTVQHSPSTKKDQSISSQTGMPYEKIHNSKELTQENKILQNKNTSTASLQRSSSEKKNTFTGSSTKDISKDRSDQSAKKNPANRSKNNLDNLKAWKSDSTINATSNNDRNSPSFNGSFKKHSNEVDAFSKQNTKQQITQDSLNALSSTRKPSNHNAVTTDTSNANQVVFHDLTKEKISPAADPILTKAKIDSTVFAKADTLVKADSTIVQADTSGKAVKKEKNNSTHTFAISLFGGPEKLLSNLAPSTMKTSSSGAYSAGLRADYFITEKLSVNAGLGLIQLHNRYNYHYTALRNDTTHHVTTDTSGNVISDSISIASNTHDYSATANASYTYLTLPMGLSYRIGSGKLFLTLSGSLALSYLVHHHETVSDNSFAFPSKHSLNVFLSASSALNYRLSKSIALFIEPDFKYGLGTLYSSKHPSFLGVNGGITILFGGKQK
ncbi:MAG TPA: outer membrane beta-barrel protein [Cytophagaceae bacterium]|nr:outer membrane beta-barrel protein [Cytophagaceae bacterium]